MIKNKNLLILLFVGFILLSCSQNKTEKTQSITDPRIKEIDSAIIALNKQDLFQGQIVITENGNVDYENIFDESCGCY